MLTNLATSEVFLVFAGLVDEMYSALMDWPFKALSALWLVPAPLRDFGYATVAKYRYKVFGKTAECRVPSGDFRKRFIDYRPEEEAPADPISGAKTV